MVAQSDAFCLADTPAWGDTPLDVVAQGRLDLFGEGFARAADARSPDILHLHGIWGAASRGAWSLARSKNHRPMMISAHGMLETWALAQSRWKKRLAWKAWNGRLIRSANCLHALCDEEATSIANLLPGARICIIPNGVDLPSEFPEVERDSERKIILFVGRIHPKKGLSPLIEAWARAPGIVADGWRLTVAGWDDGGHERALRARVDALGLGASVAFVGSVSGAGKDELFRKASAFILPSLSEGLPMSVLEAWSYGLPVLMTDECHLTSGFAEGAARRIEPTVASIVEGLEDFAARANRGGLDSMGKRGRALVERRYSWAHIGADMADVYEWLLGGIKPACVVD
jgi:glycosyltransferase involved in cell wall biosynthesis